MFNGRFPWNVFKAMCGIATLSKHMLELGTTLQGEVIELSKANNKVDGADDPRILSALQVCNDTGITVFCCKNKNNVRSHVIKLIP